MYSNFVFEKRSHKLERIDTGDYTTEEFETFLREIRFINRVLGDVWALRKTILREIETKDLREFSVIDVGAGSGELLREIAEFGRKQNRKTKLCGLDLNEISARTIFEESKSYDEIHAVRGDGLNLPFAENAFDYAICSLFTHHLTDEAIVRLFGEMSRVARRGVFVIDLHRHKNAYLAYKIFCVVFRISRLVREDGSLSILRSFTPDELKLLGEKANLENVSVEKHFPSRLVLRGG